MPDQATANDSHMKKPDEPRIGRLVGVDRFVDVRVTYDHSITSSGVYFIDTIRFVLSQYTSVCFRFAEQRILRTVATSSSDSHGQRHSFPLCQMTSMFLTINVSDLSFVTSRSCRIDGVLVLQSLANYPLGSASRI
jgi:hypothetical protein